MSGNHLVAQRQQAILNEARIRGFVKVADLAQRFDVSAITVRRDVGALVDAGELVRVHGGAALASHGSRAGARRRPLATIGMVVPAAQYYYQDVIAGAEESAARAGMRLVLAVSHYDPPEERALVERMLRADVDALLVATARSPHEEEPEWLRSTGVPTVLVERRWDDPGVDHARSDHGAGARIAVEHLARVGHSRVGIAVRGSTPTAHWLIDGFLEATRGEAIEAGFEPFDMPLAEETITSRNALLGELLERCAETGTRAVLVHTDEDAVALLGLAIERGMRVPEDLAIVAYDDEIAGLAPVPLTAVSPPKRDVGRAAVDLAVRRLQIGGAAATQHTTLLPRLVVRASTGESERF
jgi:DNA-binding LacI/PurR family transcriptional regulator